MIYRTLGARRSVEFLGSDEREVVRRRNVLLFCPRLWSNAAVERRARLEIRALTAAGHRVLVATDQALPYDSAERWPDITALAPAIMRPPTLLARWTAGKLLAFFFNSVRLLARSSGSEIDVVLSHTPVSVVAAYPWSRRHKVRLVYVCHVPPVSSTDSLPQSGSGSRLPTRLVSGWADRIAIRIADTVICPSGVARSWHAKARPRKETVSLPNPVDTTRFRPDLSVRKDIDVLFVGRLSHEKGPEDLMRAAALLAAPARFVLIGEGKERQRLHVLASDVSSDVEFVGWLNNDALPDWYRRARVVVVPSYYESQGMSAAEALACGTPVIASAVGGLLDAVREGVNGWLVPPGDPQALARSIDRALRSGAIEELGSLRYEFGEDRFSDEFVRILRP